MKTLIDLMLLELYKKKEQYERRSSELETTFGDDIVIAKYEGKVEAYSEVINMITTNGEKNKTSTKKKSEC